MKLQYSALQLDPDHNWYYYPHPSPPVVLLLFLAPISDSLCHLPDGMTQISGTYEAIVSVLAHLQSATCSSLLHYIAAFLPLIMIRDNYPYQCDNCLPCRLVYSLRELRVIMQQPSLQIEWDWLCPLVEESPRLGTGTIWLTVWTCEDGMHRFSHKLSGSNEEQAPLPLSFVSWTQHSSQLTLGIT